MIAALLAKLAVHYYAPDFTEAQAKSKITDLVNDLIGFGMYEIEQAVNAYRQDANERFFPTGSGPLIKRIREVVKEVAQSKSGERWAESVRNFDSRPLSWWLMPRRFWKAHWKVSDIPTAERATYDLFIQRVKDGKVLGKTAVDYY